MAEVALGSVWRNDVAVMGALRCRRLCHVILLMEGLLAVILKICNSGAN
jgi:hypothetical protein